MEKEKLKIVKHHLEHILFSYIEDSSHKNKAFDL
jgi:hypothetical protein